MPASNVQWPPPLTRFPTLWPGQPGVPGTDSDRGERMHCTGEIFYVDPNFPGVSNLRDGTSPTSPLRTVAAALALVQPQRGDVIAVMSNDNWYYAPGGMGVSTDYVTPISEEVTIPYTASGVRIVGLSNSPLGVMWQPASNAGTCITVHAIDVTIEGFVFTEGAYTACDAISAEWDGVTMFGENLTVRHCVFDDTVDTAIQLEYSWYCDIHDNVFWYCGAYGIYADPLGSGSTFNLIYRNRFHYVTTSAISMANAATDENHIYENAIYGDPTGTDNFIDLAGGADNMVDHNTMACNLGAQYTATCSDATSGAWIHNYLLNGVTTSNP